MKRDALMATDSGPAPKATIFISYSRKDMAFADRLEAALKTRGFEPVIDRSEIYAFEDWWKRIEALIGRADTVVFVLSPHAIAWTRSCTPPRSTSALRRLCAGACKTRPCPSTCGNST